MSHHARYEELSVGYALDALEPEDEQDLLRHLAGCTTCLRDVAQHRETLSHLAYAADAGAPPPAVWDRVRAAVEAESGPAAFRTGPLAAPVPQVLPAVTLGPVAPTGLSPLATPGVADLATARRRSLRRGRAAGLTAVAASVALVAAVGYGVAMQRERDAQGQVSQRLAAAVRAVETAPARTVPLSDSKGNVTAVAVVQSDRVSLIVDGLPVNDASSSVYVLWGKDRVGSATALATFDVRSGSLDVVHDVPLPGAADALDLFAITHEHGRTAPELSVQAPVAVGRPA